MSIVIVAFEGAPRLSEEAVKQDQDLDAKIEAKIKGKLHHYTSENRLKYSTSYIQKSFKFQSMFGDVLKSNKILQEKCV